MRGASKSLKIVNTWFHRVYTESKDCKDCKNCLQAKRSWDTPKSQNLKSCVSPKQSVESLFFWFLFASIVINENVITLYHLIVIMFERIFSSCTGETLEINSHEMNSHEMQAEAETTTTIMLDRSHDTSDRNDRINNDRSKVIPKKHRNHYARYSFI